jgi:tetratricopeptide (TPR) repeat protein
MRALLVACLVGIVLAPAFAQPVPEAESQARAHYQRGITHYDLSEFDAAIAEFKKAYELTKAPALVYNIAQAYRLKGDKPNALSSYKAYLRLDPSAGNRAEVEGHVSSLEKGIAEDRRREEELRREAPPRSPPAKSAPSKPAPAAPSSPAKEVMRVDANVMRVEVAQPRGNRTMMRAGWITAAAGVVVVGAGTWFAVKAARNWDAVQTVDEEMGPWGAEHQGEWDDAQDQELAAKILFGVGGVGLVTGGILYFFGARADAPVSGLSLVPVSGGGVVAAGGSF